MFYLLLTASILFIISFSSGHFWSLISSFQSTCTDPQLQRHLNIQRWCSTYKRDMNITNWDLRPSYFMIVDDRHKVIYCMIPKVACTTFQKLMARSLTNDTINLTRIHFVGFINSLGMRFLDKYSKKDRELRLQTYFKFTVVRHPFDRLLSAYADKFANPGRNMMSVAHLQKRAEMRFGNFTRFDEKGKPLLSLNQFLELVSRDREFHDKHWQSYHDLCQPCAMNYDHVIRLETIDNDIGPVLEHLNYTRPETGDKQENSRRNVSNKLVEVNYHFRRLNPGIMNGLLQIYARDFQLFGYSWSYAAGAGCVNRTGNGMCC
ncbi:hypothetical protein LSH36_414g03007 [Paralvinella palmiformis]|uniref:Carbohydrate sulfotransferase n=1 Tax=Paralvinella palmiformis TaxID=53620 RepID=A0AAD9MYL8_9ANNE|nr:hypothetical protein LSH36_414g03007 [Paralvinella palmiformis]